MTIELSDRTAQGIRSLIKVGEARGRARAASDLVAAGWSHQQVGDAFGVSRQRVYQMIQEYEDDRHDNRI